MERSEEEDLDDAALGVMRFLGQVYVNLQEAIAVEEYVCEQYEASIRFVRRCCTGCSKTSSSKDFGKTSSQSSNGTGQAREPRKQTVTGPDDDTSKQEQELADLCEYLDSVLGAAQAVRERCNETKRGKSRGKSQEPKRASNQTVGVEDVPGSGNSIPVATTVNEMNLVPVSRTGDKINRPKSTMDSIGSRKTLKFQRSLVHGTPGASNKKRSRKTCPVKQSNENSRLLPSARPNPISASVSRSKEDLAIKSSASMKTDERCRLQFPEKYRAIRSWFKAREAYRINTYAVSRTKIAAEEVFMSLCDDVNHEQDSNDDEYKNAASPIRELQNIVQDMASRTSKFQMLRLHRLAPTGSKIEEMRNFIVHNLSPLEGKDCYMGTEQARHNLEFAEVPNSSWLPQRCWEHLCQVFSSSQLDGLSAKDLEQGLVTYSEPEQVVGISRLSHCIQVTLFHYYLEEVFGPALLRTTSRKEEEQGDMIGLLRCQLAHSILCKEGRELFALAERITATV